MTRHPFQRMRLTTLALPLAVVATMATSAVAQDYSWPDNIPPEAKEMMEPMPLSPRGQAVVGFPEGPPASSPDSITFTDEELQTLKDGNFTAAISMNVMDAAWPQLQVAGITAGLKEYGIELVAVTEAKGQPATQLNDLEQLAARQPDVILSIPIDPVSSSPVFKRISGEGIKIVFIDNVPVDMEPGKDYVSVIASDNEANGYFAAKAMAEEMGGKGKVGILTTVYNSAYVIVAREAGARKAFAEYPDITEVDPAQFPGTMTGAYSASSAMITANADLGGIFAVWDTPAIQAANAAKTLGRDVLVATVDLGEDSAVAVANGEIYSIGAQRPFMQGMAEAKAAAAALLGKEVPPYLSVAALKVKKINLLSALQEVTQEPPPESVIKACDGECF
ncbi:substrate-binding domain-containing protein [Bauldia litoralis]|uniref:Ribose transport system substrate-binding protein n=1 Tax=Bauldia litoralis TaxID=665467 RepID=A0A1G6E6N0_9HYPH|nr:substrate-binding domain-containing protein [Bauldia litoralis]SDB53038.1 ribose transport system substrate-binding protein [Bauldia litoralis]